MEPSVVAAAASISAALIALLGTFVNRRKTMEAAKETRKENRRLSEDLKQIDARQQTNIATFQSDLDRMTYVFNANHSKRVEVLTESYAKLVEIKLLMESFVVPLFAHSVTGNQQTIREAADKFEELYRYSSMNLVYFRKDSKFTEKLGQVMGHINHMQNNATAQSSWNQQAQIVINGVDPILHEISAEVRAELKLDF